ncbi:RNA polymerase sigma factor [Aeromicrobium massiliense]|uniref:RNA polymerase sigma factor n=1 Tax=Aeromicrobium massiliense TaxID=1464554 RepID=UPI0002D5D2DC|nr:sigma-70 family RNA polymerase sigma factor [Aeromicrobium massiliense]
MGTPDRTAALRAAVRDNADDVLRYLERRVVDREDAADLLAETLVVAWRRIDDLPDAAEHRRMWMYGIARLTLSNQRRAHRRRSALVERLRGELAAAPQDVADPAHALAVRDAVDRLPSGQAELVRLVHWDGLSLAEASCVLGWNPSTARGRYAAARAALQEALAERVHG